MFLFAESMEYIFLCFVGDMSTSFCSDDNYGTFVIKLV